ncbi:hypothetical protein BT63DRAFT_452507 [Microthyrium microscopicum]|uniref:Uncharacterized protein n=1 Tax=Microthyrium microscopicum TaxID=703497 RepID=A0A6A6UII2_9PEZI|nr:hypothetical protein BT63DRAFT_452507 [Microthyrium microscopicum]
MLLDSNAERMAYRIGRGEQGVLTFEPYKSELLPHWRFRTPDIARQSSETLWEKFKDFGKEGDFIGMDMSRKFIQMAQLPGMTRAKRYAQHKGGRKYNRDTGEELPKSQSHVDYADKLEASETFKAVWARCREDEIYQKLKGEFQEAQKEWDKAQCKAK